MASAVFNEKSPNVPDGFNIIVFQGPNNKGLSGSPLISNRTGHVVGIVSGRIVGITKELVAIRQEAAKVQNAVRFGGGGASVAPGEAILQLINVLDAFLMSGMGSAFAMCRTH